jgi:hypothetical protein
LRSIILSAVEFAGRRTNTDMICDNMKTKIPIRKADIQQLLWPVSLGIPEPPGGFSVARIRIYSQFR